MKKIVLTMSVILLVAHAGMAHDVWFVKKADHLELRYGHETPEVYNPVKVKNVKALDRNAHPVEVRPVALPETFGLVLDPTVALLTVEFDNGFWVSSDSKEWKNVSEEVARTFPSYSYPIKYHKSLYAWNPMFAKPVGLALEIVPLRNPFTKGKTLPVQVLFEGKPVPGATVEYGIHGDKAPTVTAAADGKANVPVSESGEQFMAVDLKPDSTDARKKSVAYATSLRFER